MIGGQVLLAGWLVFSGGAGASVSEPERSPASSDQPVAMIGELPDLTGEIHRLSPSDTGAIRVFVFVSTTCPISLAYTKELSRLAQGCREGTNHTVRFFGVLSDREIERAEATKRFAEYKVEFPILFDPNGRLAGLLKPTHLPEAFVLDEAGRVLYRGAIDNAYESIGRRRPQAERTFLRDAIQAASHGLTPPVTFATPIGCVWPAGETRTSSSPVTYTRHIAPLLQKR